MERSDLMIKSLAVYCGAHLGNDPIYQARAAAFGKKMAQNGIELVYGGGKYGTMGVIANAVLDNGGKVHGVITRQLYERQTALDRVEDLKIVSNMDVRKDLMMDLADGLVALPGGIGTLEEISEAFSWMSLGDNAKPTALYNVNGFYDPLRNMLRRMHDTGFLEQSYLDAIHFAYSFDDLMKFMNHYRAPARRQYR